MDLQKDFLNMQIAYEKNCAIRCNCSYEELKAQLDRSESLFGTRYLEGSPRHENWLLWVEAWQAAKEQAVLEVKPSRHVTLTCAQLREAFMFGAPDKDDQEQLETEMTITWSENGHSGKGYYCYYSDLPEEGAIFLDDVIEAQEPSNEH